MILFQFKEFLISYNKLTEMCFLDCISDFTSRAIKGKEVSIHFITSFCTGKNHWQMLNCTM